MVPILGCAMFLGGVTPGEIFRITLALASLLFFSLAIGLWVSSRSRSASHAMGGTFVLLLLFLLVPWPVNFHPFAFLSPAWAFFGAGGIELQPSHPLAYWASLLVAQIFVVVLLARAAANTNLFREDEPGKPSPSATNRNRRPTPGWKQRGELLEANPVSWLAGRNGGAGILIWMMVLLAVAAVSGFFIAGLLRLGTPRIDASFYTVFGMVLVVHLVKQ